MKDDEDSAGENFRPGSWRRGGESDAEAEVADEKATPSLFDADAEAGDKDGKGEAAE